VSAEPQPSVQ